jgi:hypothetical protein
MATVVLEAQASSSFATSLVPLGRLLCVPTVCSVVGVLAVCSSLPHAYLECC